MEERCPYCRQVLDTIAVKPGVTVLHSRRCGSRQCRKAKRGALLFQIKNGIARVLTNDERAAIVNNDGVRTVEAKRGVA